jgi:hypothetical protein
VIGSRSYRVAYLPFAVSQAVHCNWNASSSCRCILAHRVALDHQSTVAAASQHDTTAGVELRRQAVVRALRRAAEAGGGTARAAVASTPQPCGLQCASCAPPTRGRSTDCISTATQWRTGVTDPERTTR